MEFLKDNECVAITLEEVCRVAFGTDEREEKPRAFSRDPLFFPETYEENVPLETLTSAGEVPLLIKGQAEGLFLSGKTLTVDLVRVIPAAAFLKSPPRILAQKLALCAGLAARSRGAKDVKCRLVLVHSEDGTIRTLVKKYSASDLEGLWQNVLGLLARRVYEFRRNWLSVRPAAAQVPFPYSDLREGQWELVQKVLSAVKKGKRLFVQAPTGIGKTMSVLYPAVRSFGKGYCDKIFYLTAKSSTAREAYHAAGLLYSAGAPLRTIVLTAKEQMCLESDAKAGKTATGKFCHARECPYMRDYSGRARAALDELLNLQSGYYAAVIRQVAEKYQVCPYELSLDLSEYCDLIICDYNYLFDPMVHLQRYFDNPGAFGSYVFLMDEAHNMVDRLRAMYSVTLSEQKIAEFYALLPSEEGMLRGMTALLLQGMGSLRDLCRDNRQTLGDGRETGYYISAGRVLCFDKCVTAFEEKMSIWLKANREHPFFDAADALYGEVRRYVTIMNFYDEKFTTYIEMTGQDLTISLSCLDPSEVADGCLSLGRAAVYFSATLTPLSYFSDLLGGGRHPEMLELASPFPRENLCLAAVDGVSTRFEDRDTTYKKVASCIAAAVSAKAGNYMVYFPSYGYLEKVYAAFTKKYPGVNTAVQKRGMHAAEREEFLSYFKDDEGKMRIGFCVLGGLFSEGVDLPGKRLIGSIIVGVGLPGFSSERNIMRDYFENRYENGFEYAYTYPGMNGVLQAAGRVIRREDDRGIVVLIDDRYATPTYQALFPEHWKHLQYAGNAKSLAEIARKFWENGK